VSDQFYINGGNCSSCSIINNCLSCSSESVCTNCVNDQFYLNAGACPSCGSAINNCVNCALVGATLQCTTCNSDNDLSDDKLACNSKGASTIIIVSAVVGGVVLLGAGFAIFKCMRKKKAGLLPAEEEYEKL